MRLIYGFAAFYQGFFSAYECFREHKKYVD